MRLVKCGRLTINMDAVASFVELNRKEAMQLHLKGPPYISVRYVGIPNLQHYDGEEAAAILEFVRGNTEPSPPGKHTMASEGGEPGANSLG